MLSRLLQVKALCSDGKIELPRVTLPDASVIFHYGVAHVTSSAKVIFF